MTDKIKSAHRQHIVRRKSFIKQLSRNLRLAGLGLLLVLASLGVFYTRAGTHARVYAATSSNLNFQARLYTTAGSTVPDGTYNIEFKLYDSLAAGASVQGVCVGGATDDCQWVESRTGANKVTVRNGYFSVQLGSVTSLPTTINWDQDLWLTMNIGGSGTPGWDGEMSPRIKLTAVPYAMQAGRLTRGSGSVTADDLVQLSPSTIQAVNTALAALRVNQTGAGGLIQFQGDGADVFTVNKAGDGYFKGALDIDAALTAGGGNAFSVNSFGDITSAFTALNGSSTTSSAALTATTSMLLADATNFDVGNYVQVNSANCGGVGINPCYAKITAKVGNTLTITPGLTWASGATVNEYHVPELGGINSSQALANRYGRGYFIAGVATGNGTTYYNEGEISTSLSTFDLLNTGVTTLNIGGAASTINLGTAGTTLVLPGTFQIQGATLDVGTATQQGSLKLHNGDSKTGTIQAGSLSANRTYTLPDVDGTICLTTTCGAGPGGPTNAFEQDGNSFGALATLGTNDNNNLAFETNGTRRMTLDTSGNLGIGLSGTASQLLSIGGTTGNFTVSSAGAVNAVGLTSSSGLTVSAGGASITGGLNNNSGGITNAGSITGVGTEITAAAGLTIASSGSGNLTLNSASGLAVLGASTLQTANNLLLDISNALDTTLSLQNSGAGITHLNLVDGGLQTGGTLRLTNAGVLQNITGLTVSSGDALFNGNVVIGDTATDRLTVNSHLLGGSPLTFQGATDNSFATTLALIDPTANNTITLPNASGTLVLDTRSITTAAGSGLTGGGNLSVDRSISLDINGLTTKTNVNPTDYIAVHDATTSAIRKITRNDFLQGLIGALIYRGTWDASTNTPTLADNTGTNGHMYVVTVGGSQNFGQGPQITFSPGDFVIHNGTDWEKATSSSDVASVFGRTGAVTAQNGDYTASQITNVAAGNIAAVTLQAAINELDSEKISSLNGLTAVSQTFVNDTNVTITSSGSTHTLGWSGQLSVVRGGTGVGTFTTNGVLYGNGTGALQVSGAGTGGQVLIANVSGIPTFTSLSGDITVSSTGVTTIGANAVDLTTNTTGNYLASLGTVTGLTIGGTNGVEGGIPTLAVNYGSLANTAVQGNTTLTVTAGTNLGGGGTITLGTGGTVTLNTVNAPVFTTSVTSPIFTNTAGLTLSSGGTGDITLDSASNKIIIAGTDTILERTAAGSYTIDLKDNAATSLVLSNSTAGGSSVANLNLLDGVLQIAGTTVIGSDRTLQNLLGITNVGAFTTSGGIASINAGSNFATNINTGLSSGTITLGGGSAPLVINSTAFDVSSTGALSGITTINASGLATLTGGATLSTSVNSTTTLTVNATSGTAATATIINQAGAADGLEVNLTNTTGTIGAGLQINRNGAGGTTTSGLEILNAAGTLTDAITIGSGTQAITRGINLNSTGITTDIRLQNGETIHNDTNGEVIFQTDGTTTIFRVSAGALQMDIGAAIAANGQRLCHSGADGNAGLVSIGDCNTLSADLAEYYGSDGTPQAGDLVAMTGQAEEVIIRDTKTSKAWVKRAEAGERSKVIGVVSTSPSGEIMSEGVFSDSEHPVPVALAGRVPIKISLENGSIALGDKLTLSSTPGAAMKATGSGMIIGTALESYDGSNPQKSKIIVFINLGWWGGPATSSQTNGLFDASTIATNGTLRLDGDGFLQNINGLNLVSGGASVVGGINNNDGGLINTGSILGATTVEAQSLALKAGATGNMLTLTKDNKGEFTVFNNGALEIKLDSKNAFAVKKSDGQDIFKINTEGGLVSIGSYLPDDKAMLLVLDSLNTPGDPAGVNGAQYYNSTSNRFRCFENGAWRDCLSLSNSEYVLMSQSQTWLQPAQEQEMPGEPRSWVDLTNSRQYRMVVRLSAAGAPSASCRLQYALSETEPWNDLSADSKASMSLATVGTLKTDWLDLGAEARGEIIIRAVCKGGDGTAEPKLYGLRLQLR